jgi:hypothetical protein
MQCFGGAASSGKPAWQICKAQPMAMAGTREEDRIIRRAFLVVRHFGKCAGLKISNGALLFCLFGDGSLAHLFG